MGAPAACAAVVKANAYGLGAAPVALALMGVGCRRFFVATLDEGIALRATLGDGNFGGRYQRSDEDMLAVWQVAVEETRALIEGPWE